MSTRTTICDHFSLKELDPKELIELSSSVEHATFSRNYTQEKQGRMRTVASMSVFEGNIGVFINRVLESISLLYF